MYRISYEKCVCFIFLVILAFLSCSGFHIDRIPLPDHNKKYIFTSSNSNNAHVSKFISQNMHRHHEQMLEDGSSRFREEGVSSQLDETRLRESGPTTVWAPRHATERRRRRRIRNTRSRTHHERHHDTRINQTPSKSSYQRPGRGESRAESRKSRGKNQRKGKNRFCPGQDVATRAFHARTVLEGKIRSRTKIDSNSNYNVTFEVKDILKDKSKNLRPLRINESIRLQFSYDVNSRVDNCDFKEINGVIPARFNMSKNYILFANRVGNHEYKILGPPVVSSKKALLEIKNMCCGKAKGKIS